MAKKCSLLCYGGNPCKLGVGHTHERHICNVPGCHCRT